MSTNQNILLTLFYITNKAITPFPLFHGLRKYIKQTHRYIKLTLRYITFTFRYIILTLRCLKLALRYRKLTHPILQTDTPIYQTDTLICHHFTWFSILMSTDNYCNHITGNQFIVFMSYIMSTVYKLWCYLGHIPEAIRSLLHQNLYYNQRINMHTLKQAKPPHCWHALQCISTTKSKKSHAIFRSISSVSKFRLNNKWTPKLQHCDCGIFGRLEEVLRIWKCNCAYW